MESRLSLPHCRYRPLRGRGRRGREGEGRESSGELIGFDTTRGKRKHEEQRKEEKDGKARGGGNLHKMRKKNPVTRKIIK